MIHDIEVEVHHEKIIITKTTIHKTDTVLHLEIVLVMPKALLLHSTLVHGMAIIKATRDLIDPHPNYLIDVIPVTDIDHAHILEITILHDKHLLLDLLRDQKILGFLDITHTQIQEINLKQSNHKPKMINCF